MDYDLGTDEDNKVQDFVGVPPGTYLCRVEEVAPGQTRNGDERWGMRLVIAEGEFVGRQAAWDGLVFSERGRTRTRRVLAALGLPASGRVSIEPEDLVGRQAFVEITPQEYRDPMSGQKVRRNGVPYDGYRAAGESPGRNGRSADEDDGDEIQRMALPF